MIGFFDSGLGGLAVLKEVVKLLPDYPYIYLGDNARAPYGSRSQEVIYKYTVEGVKELFNRGAELVILACNTSSSAALRKIQQEFLPQNYPGRKVLGIIIPTAEESPKLTKTKEIGILATEATVNSRSYVNEIKKINPDIKIYQQACPLFVPIIEAGEAEWAGMDLAIEKYLAELFVKSKNIDTIILGCTHYAIIEDKIRRHLDRVIGRQVRIVSQGRIIAEKLKDYLDRHSEIEKKLHKSAVRRLFFTESAPRLKDLSAMFYGEDIVVEKLSIN